jgi:hypothetical protein
MYVNCCDTVCCCVLERELTCVLPRAVAAAVCMDRVHGALWTLMCARAITACTGQRRASCVSTTTVYQSEVRPSTSVERRGHDGTLATVPCEL